MFDHSTTASEESINAALLRRFLDNNPQLIKPATNETSPEQPLDYPGNLEGFVVKSLVGIFHNGGYGLFIRNQYNSKSDSQSPNHDADEPIIIELPLLSAADGADNTPQNQLPAKQPAGNNTLTTPSMSRHIARQNDIHR